MTHYILAYNSLGPAEGVEGKFPKIKEFGEVGVFLEGRDYRHGYFTYSEGELLRFFREHGVAEHPHELSEAKRLKMGRPVSNHSDELAAMLLNKDKGSIIITELEHEDSAPKIVRDNYRRFRVRRG